MTVKRIAKTSTASTALTGSLLPSKPAAKSGDILGWFLDCEDADAWIARNEPRPVEVILSSNGMPGVRLL